ncbi:MAG: imidazolonepropionase [Oligoflexia bacterium]|nr:imidazolonepropionase [Oligoflexia bacterium]
MTVIRNIGYLAVCKSSGAQHELHAIKRAAVVFEGKTISWVGEDAKIPAAFKGHDEIDVAGRLVIPGLIDCHSHLCFMGWRAEEFEKRILGKSYTEIAAAGGGILSTVRKTRLASSDQLFQRCLDFLPRISELGVTTLECKSGYGLSLEHELKTLRVYQRLAEYQPITIVPTFLGAHTVPEEYKERTEDYLRLVTDEMLPQIVKDNLALFADIFVEKGAFSYEQGQQVLSRAKALKLRLKIHADQLSNTRGAELAAEQGAISADHLEHISEQGIQALKKSKTTAVLLPLATMCTNQPPAPGRKLIEAGVRVAVATDFNPGSAPSYHLPFNLTLACLLNRITPAEAIKGATINAAHALALDQICGSVEVGKMADLAVLDAESPEQWLYHFTANACAMTIKAGEIIHQSGTF